MTIQGFATIILEIINALTERQRDVIKLRFGLSDGRSRTLQEVGMEFGVSRERIRQIESQVLRVIRGSRIKIMQAVETELNTGNRSPLTDYQRLVSSLRPVANHPQCWLLLLQKSFPHYMEFTNRADELREYFYRLRWDVVYRSDFIEYLAADFQIIEQDAITIWNDLQKSDSKYYWMDDAAIVKRYAPLAYYVINKAGEPLHWREVHERVDTIASDRDLSASGVFNAMQNSDWFVRTGTGTYGLRDLGHRREPYQKDKIASVLEIAESHFGIGATFSANDLITVLDHIEAGIPHSSINLYLAHNRLFYEDLDGKFGLRKWLPPPEEQRLDTPRRLRESKRSRERLNR